MKEIGEVTEYNGYYGIIVDEKGTEYLLLKEEILDEEDLKIKAKVSFVSDEYLIPDENKNSDKIEPIARFVKKINKNIK